MISVLKGKNSMRRVWLTCVIAVYLTACKKEVTELPAATQTGANVFGARVNGSYWVPKGVGVFGKPMLEAHYDVGRTVVINARNFASTPKESEFEIRIKNAKTPGVYELNDASGCSVYYVERKFTPTGEWKTNNQYGGKITVTYTDTTAKIISGTFEFEAASLYEEAPLSVTEGRFDVKVD